MSREDDYRLAYKLAAEKLLCSDIEERCTKSGASYSTKDSNHGVISVDFLNKTCLIKLPEIEISYQDDGGEVPLWAKILILHYLNAARGEPLTHKQITFKEVTAGNFYYSSFAKRAKDPLIQVFGNQPELLLKVSEELGGRQIDAGDMGVNIPAFSRVPIHMILWRGDEEFPPDGNIMFDSTIGSYLSTEDVAVLTQMIMILLIGNKKKMGN